MTNLSPTQRKYWLSNGKLANSIKLEWVNRIDNLCALSGTAMSPDLRSWVESVFGLEMVRVIQDYSIYTAPKLSPDIRNVINSAIPNFYDGVDINIEFARLFDKNCCPSICLTVARANQLPDPPTGCEFALVETKTETTTLYALYHWDGSQWSDHISVIIDYGQGLIGAVNLFIPTSGWSAIINGTTYTADDTIIFAPSVTRVDVTFISPERCQYVMERVEVSAFVVNIEDSYLASVPFDYNDLNDWNTYLGTDFTYLSSSPISTFTQFFLWNPSAPITIPANAFAGWDTFGVGEYTYNKRTVIEVGANAFFDMTSNNSSPYDINPDIIGDGAFGYTLPGFSPLSYFDFSKCTQLGSTSGDDGVFANVTGSTIIATFNSVLQTNNAGGVDGDIAYLVANNTVTITWV